MEAEVNSISAKLNPPPPVVVGLLAPVLAQFAPFGAFNNNINLIIAPWMELIK